MIARLDKYSQWIELYNTTNRTLNLEGWKIVGRYLDDTDTINLLETQSISEPFVVKSKEAVLIASATVSNTRNNISEDLANKTYTLGDKNVNFWNYKGLVLELQNAQAIPIDRIGNLNENNEVVWEIPDIVRNKRVSLIRRLKSIDPNKYNFKFGIKKFGWFPADDNDQLSNNKNQYYYGSIDDIGTPGYKKENDYFLPVKLSSFNTKLNKDGKVEIRWITESEIDNAGFNIYRSQSKNGNFVKINNNLIPGAGTTGERNTYIWKDTTAKSGIEYYYRITDVSFSGEHQTLATKRLFGIHTAKNRLLTSWGQLKE